MNTNIFEILDDEFSYFKKFFNENELMKLSSYFILIKFIVKLDS